MFVQKSLSESTRSDIKVYIRVQTNRNIQSNTKDNIIIIAALNLNIQILFQTKILIDLKLLAIWFKQIKWNQNDLIGECWNQYVV